MTMPPISKDSRPKPKTSDLRRYPGRRAGRELITAFLASTALFWACSVGVARADQVPINLDRLADSVWKAEGGEKASVPYGLIYSGWCKQEPGWCRYYASEIVSIKYAQWVRHGRPGEFIDYLGASYCPPSAHPLNAHWTRNVKRFYKKASGQAQFEMETEPVSAVRE